MNAKPFTRFASPFLRVLLPSVLLLGLGPVAQPAVSVRAGPGGGS